MKNRNIYLIIVCCLLLLTGCADSSRWTATLDRAEAAMNTHPDRVVAKEKKEDAIKRWRQKIEATYQNEPFINV